MAQGHVAALLGHLAARYDTDGSPSRAVHERWAGTLPCRVLRIDGAQPVDGNVERITREYAVAVGPTGIMTGA